MNTLLKLLWLVGVALVATIDGQSDAELLATLGYFSLLGMATVARLHNLDEQERLSQSLAQAEARETFSKEN